MQREIVDLALLGYPLRGLCYLALERGDYGSAAELCAASLRLNLAIEDRLAAAACLVARAGVAAAKTRIATAWRLPALGCKESRPPR